MRMKKAMKAAVLVFVIAVLTTLATSATISDLPNIRVRHEGDFESLNVENYFVNQEPDPAEPGSYVDVRWKIENTGTAPIENLLVEVLPKYPFSLEPGESAVQNIGSLESRQTGKEGVIVKYRLRIDENAVEGDNEIQLRYSTDNGKTWTLLEPFNVRIESHDVILSVESVSSIPPKISPGKEASVIMELKNLASTFIKDVKVTLKLVRITSTTTSVSYAELPFSPVGSTNERIISMIKPGEKKKVEFKVIADPDAEAKIYKVPVELQYSDRLGRNYSKERIISLVVREEPDLTAAIEDTNILQPGSVGAVTVKFVNKGVSEVKFLNAELKESSEYDILSSPSIYIGNIDSDDYETAEFKLFIKPSSKKEVVLPIQLSYKDSINEDYRKTVSLKLRLYTKEEIERFGLVKRSNTGRIVTAVVVLLIIYLIYKRWKRVRARRLRQKAH